MKSPWCVKSEPLLTAEWTWDIRFQSFLLWFFCAHRFNAHTGLVCFIYQQTSHFLRRRLCGRAVVRDFYPAEAEACAAHSLRVSSPRLVSLHLHGSRADIIALYTWSSPHLFGESASPHIWLAKFCASLDVRQSR